MKRGDVALADYPHADGSSSKRPVLVIQSDVYNKRIRNTVVAQITSTLTRTGDPAHLAIDISTADGKRTGLLRNSVVSCNNLSTVDQSWMQRKIGELSDAHMKRIDDCLKAAPGIP
jgi:mRNA-degrading endonuclease toxin of MazEF toxin-antitoxin module